MSVILTDKIQPRTTGIAVTLAGDLDVTGAVSVAGTITYEDVTNVDSVGLITARTGVRVTAGGLVVTAGVSTFSNQLNIGSNIKAGTAGVVTATSFSGSGANLTGIDATALKDGNGTVRVQANTTGAVVTGTATATTFSGNITGVAATFSGAVSVGGTLTYEDVTNVDSVGLITARNGIKVTGGDIDVTNGDIDILADDKKLKIGAGSDLQLTHDGTDSFINNSTGHLYIRSNTGIDITNALGTKNMIVCTNAGEVEIFHNNVKKIETTSGGVKVSGNYTENIVAVSGTAVDCATGSYFTKTITGATTFTFTNVPTGVAYAFTFEVTLNGSNAITWPGSVKWPADTAPTITDGKTQVFVFLTDDGGTRWRGSSLVDYTN